TGITTESSGRGPGGRSATRRVGSLMVDRAGFYSRPVPGHDPSPADRGSFPCFRGFVCYHQADPHRHPSRACPGPSSEPAMIKLEEVSKAYQETVALESISLEVTKG